MFRMIFDSFRVFFQWTIFLAIAGGLAQSFQEYRDKSRASLKKGLISLTSINDQLIHGKVKGGSAKKSKRSSSD